MNSEDTPEQDPFGPYHEFHWNGLDPVQLSKEYSLNPLVQLTFELNVLTEHAYEAKKKESEFGGKWSEIYLRAKAYQEEAMAYVKELLKSNRLINSADHSFSLKMAQQIRERVNADTDLKPKNS